MSIVHVLASLVLAMPLLAQAHGGEDHGAPAPRMTQAVAPRAVAFSEEFEAVAVLEGKKIVLYLDHFASNAPVLGAKVEIEGAGVNGVAAESSPGVYAIAAAVVAGAKYPLTISIEAGDSADLLATTLDVPALANAAAAAERGWLPWLLALLVLPVGIWLWRRRQAMAGSQ